MDSRAAAVVGRAAHTKYATPGQVALGCFPESHYDPPKGHPAEMSEQQGRFDRAIIGRAGWRGG
jgi:hypothetical protein